MYGDQPDAWDTTLTGYERLRYITNCLTRIRFCKPDGRLDLQAKGAIDNPSQPNDIAWFRMPNRASMGQRIVFGHWAALSAETQENNVFALDGGCVWGGHLCAMRLEDQTYFRAPSQQQ
jgi:bis(5'-nucleosyl)-tetraphosphatase (symmetrical)